jgi:hypothetical protein
MGFDRANNVTLVRRKASSLSELVRLAVRVGIA